MRNPCLLILTCCLVGNLFAQIPSNDECSNPVILGVAPVCLPVEYTNHNATPSDIGSNNLPSCFSTPDGGNDVWFTFVCPASPLDFRIELTPTGADPIVNPQLAVYRGVCFPDEFAELDCVSGSGVLLLDVQGLTQGAIYFIRVSSAGDAASAGTFSLCVNEMPPVMTIDQGGSSLCSGTLYDTGGPDGDYSPNEDYTFVICPGVAAACIDFTLEYYQLDAGDAFSPGFDVLSFYDGPSTNSPLLAQINGLDVGTAMDGGGGVCFRVQASSGCLTVQFQSDASEQYRGFKGVWKCSDKPCAPYEAISIEKNVTLQDIADAIAAPGAVVTVKDISKCPYGAYGTFAFDSDNNELGLRRGLVLTSGLVDFIPGPNDDSGATYPHQTPGDPDLDYLSVIQGNGLPSEDACVIELDVFVASDELAFEYVFGSEEYPEYANSLYNDIFAFFASGPGIVGDPNLGGAVNIAVLPGNNTPVQINSVNNIINWEYYRNTEISQTLQYDGFTSDFLGKRKSLTARVEVIPCNTYRLKLAIADRQDPLFDSGVFISEVRAGAPELAVQLANGLDYLAEECTASDSWVLVRLRQPKSTASTYTITLGGTATPGEDYFTNLPPTLTFQPGDSLFVFTLSPIADGLPEGKETIIITLSSDFGCGTTVFQTLEMELLDGIRLQVNEGRDTIFFCPGASVQLQASGAASYFWQPPLAVSNPNISNPVAVPTQDLALKVIGTLGSCTDTAEVFLKSIAPPIVSVTASEQILCSGDTVTLFAEVTPAGIPVSWAPKSRLSAPNSATTQAYPLTTTTYSASVQVAGCPPAFASVTLIVDTLFFPELTTPEITTCQGVTVALAAPMQLSSTSYLWSPTQGLDNATLPSPNATPEQTTTYVLTATSANGGCSRTDSVKVNVIPSSVRIAGPDTVALCLGDSLTLSAVASPEGANIQWASELWPAPIAGDTIVLTPVASGTVYTSYFVNGCLATDSVLIRVDSLPTLDIRLEPFKEIYCPGDTIYLLSEIYDPGNFPGIAHQWEPFDGQLTPPQSWNMVIIATQTHVFRRVSTSITGACKERAEILVRVDVPPQLSAKVTPPAICPGEAAQIQLTVDPPGQPITWEDPLGSLSCSSCLNPVASPTSSTTYKVSTPGATCPSSLMVSVIVLPLPALDLTPYTLCLGDSIRLNDIPANPADQYRWSVVPPGDPGSLSDSTASSPIVTPKETTTYRVLASGQCSRSGEIQVIVNSAVLEIGLDQIICPNESTTLQANLTTSPGVAGTIVWEPGPVTGSSITVVPDTTTIYTATFAFTPNCRITDSAMVIVQPSAEVGPIVADSLTSNIICEGSPLRLRVFVSPIDAQLTWFENGQEIKGTKADSIVRIPAADNDPVAVSYIVIAETANGCRDTSLPFEILVRRCIAFPNAFTPDGDGNNDTFGGPVFFGDGAVEVLDLRIFNRWGEQVFVFSPNQQTWDGRINGQPAPSDVYAYLVVVRFANGEEQTFKGDVTLLR